MSKPLMLLMLLVRDVVAGGRAGRLQRMGAEVLADRHECCIDGRHGVGGAVCVAGICAGVGGVRGSVVAAEAALRGRVVVLDVVGA